jgi:hypothetical protein
MDILDKFTLTYAEKYDFRELKVEINGQSLMLVKGFDVVALIDLEK